MKKFPLLLLLLTLLAACGPRQRARFFVQGNCPECGPLIEKTLRELPGVDSAGWSFAQSTAVVKYRANKVDMDKLQEALSKAGFETQFFPAEPAAQALLPACCREALSRRIELPQALPPGH